MRPVTLDRSRGRADGKERESATARGWGCTGMNIGRPIRILEILPESLPVPEPVPDPRGAAPGPLAFLPATSEAPVGAPLPARA